MPQLPSGRRIEFSLDRFHAMLARMDLQHALNIVDALEQPDDLLLVLDAVQFRMDDRRPFFANFVAADWASYAREWPPEDREVLRAWLDSESARHHRTLAIAGIKKRLCSIAKQRTPSAAGQPRLQ